MPGCQRRHLRLNAPVQGLAWYVTCCCVFCSNDGTWTLRNCRPITSSNLSSPTNGVTSSCLFQFRFVVTTLLLWPCLRILRHLIMTFMEITLGPSGLYTERPIRCSGSRFSRVACATRSRVDPLSIVIAQSVWPSRQVRAFPDAHWHYHFCEISTEFPLLVRSVSPQFSVSCSS